MLTFDFKTYLDHYVNDQEIKKLLNRKKEIIDSLITHNMNGWVDHFISNDELKEIKRISKVIRSNSEVFVVIGIGGSYMGSFAVSKLFSKYFKRDTECEVVYAGYTLSDEYLNEMIEYLKDKDITLNVISKSGTTLETIETYKKLYQLLEQKYHKEELKKRIIITTDEKKGTLREEVEKYRYQSFIIPKNIGGRYSIFTAANLLPLAVLLIDVESMVEGAKHASIYLNDAYFYACLRRHLYNQNKYLESFTVYEEKMYYLTEWLKQLFGESEGKNNTGIFPVSAVNTRDLHSLGQFLQEGNPIIFETILKLETLSVKNKTIIDAVAMAHYKEHTPSIIININNLKAYTVGELMYFFMLSAAFSAYLFNVDPFTQPGVEKYKQEIKKLNKKT